MIVCKKSLNPKVHIIDSNIFPNCDIVIVSILDSKLCRDGLFFVSFYKPPNINFKINHCELFKRINSISLSAQTFILGDFNAQNNIWKMGSRGSMGRDGRGGNGGGIKRVAKKIEMFREGEEGNGV